MSFVTTRPEAMLAAAGALEGLGTAVTAHNAAAAGPTTGVAPAAADPVSALQATQFNAYGTLYQQVSAQAAAIHQQVVNTLGSNAASYGATESVNTLAAGNTLAGGNPLNPLRLLSGADGGPYGIVAAAIGNGGVIGAMQLSNFGSAASDFIQLDSSELVADTESEQEAGGIDQEPDATTAPLGATGGAGVTQVAATSGQAAPTTRLSVPPSWGVTPTTEPNPAAALAEAAPVAAEETPAAGMPAGLPAAAAEHDSGGAGPSRYAVKPNLTPRPPGI